MKRRNFVRICWAAVAGLFFVPKASAVAGKPLTKREIEHRVHSFQADCQKAHGLWEKHLVGVTVVETVRFLVQAEDGSWRIKGEGRQVVAGWYSVPPSEEGGDSTMIALSHYLQPEPFRLGTRHLDTVWNAAKGNS